MPILIHRDRRRSATAAACLKRRVPAEFAASAGLAHECLLTPTQRRRVSCLTSGGERGIVLSPFPASRSDSSVGKKKSRPVARTQSASDRSARAGRRPSSDFDRDSDRRLDSISSKSEPAEKKTRPFALVMRRAGPRAKVHTGRVADGTLPQKKWPDGASPEGRRRRTDRRSWG